MATDKKKKDEKTEESVVLVITNTKGSKSKPSTAEKLFEELTERGIRSHLIITDKTYIQDSSKTSITIKSGDEEITFDPGNSSAIVRGTAASNEHGRSILKTFERCGVFMINTLEAIQLADNKYRFGHELERAGISTPKTYLIPNEGLMDNVIDKVKNFPVIVKTLTGAKGVGVFKIDKRSSMKGVLQAMWKHGAELLVQEYIKSDYDVRTIIIGGKIAGAMKRIGKKDKDFRNNVAQGGETEKHELTPEEKKLVLNAYKVSGCSIAGVDHMVTDNGLYVIEINASPGTDGISEHHPDIVDNIIDYAVKKTKSMNSHTEAGHIEKITMGDIGVMDARLDTGNDAYISMHVDEIELDGDIVRFSIDGLQKEEKVVDVKRIRTGSIVDKRPVILMDVKFGGRTYKGEKVSLTHRGGGRTPVLVSRRFLNKSGYSVHPKKKYALPEGVSIVDGVKDILNEYFGGK